MKWLKKLGNPMVLVFEGFLAGAILFAHAGLEQRTLPPPQGSALLDSSVIPNPSR